MYSRLMDPNGASRCGLSDDSRMPEAHGFVSVVAADRIGAVSRAKADWRAAPPRHIDILEGVLGVGGCTTAPSRWHTGDDDVGTEAFN
jgi:hypothetical protein